MLRLERVGVKCRASKWMVTGMTVTVTVTVMVETTKMMMMAKEKVV